MPKDAFQQLSGRLHVQCTQGGMIFGATPASRLVKERGRRPLGMLCNEVGEGDTNPPNPEPQFS